MAGDIQLAAALDQWLTAKLKMAVAGYECEIAELRQRVEVLERRRTETGGGSQGAEDRADRPSVPEFIGKRTAPVGDRLRAYTVRELKELCSLHNLPQSGVKDDLVRRLAECKVDPMELGLVEQYSAAELRSACSEAGLSTSGSKTDLARRLLQ